MFGDFPMLDPAEGRTLPFRATGWFSSRMGALLVPEQAGSVLIAQPPRRRPRDKPAELPALIEEDVAEILGNAVRFAGWLLDRVDGSRRLTDVVPVAALLGAGYTRWRTRSEHAASPSAMQMGKGGDESIIHLQPPRRHRQALTHDAERITQDFVTLLRRQRRP